MQKLEQDFDTLLASLLDTIIKEQSNRTASLTNALAIENLKIKGCKDKYSEATNLIFVSSGYELLREQLLAEQALLAFQSSKEYLEVLGRSRAESNLMKR